MSRALLILHTDAIRERAIHWIRMAPKDTRVTFQEPKRTLPQNARMWAMLTDISRQMEWHGHRLSADDWKIVLLSGLNHELRIVPNIHGNGFVNLGISSSKLSASEMHDLIELMFAFGAEYGIEWSGPDDKTEPPQGERIQPNDQGPGI